MDDLCSVCLSQDREMTTIKDGPILSLFMEIINEIVNELPIKLCWECVQNTNKILIFQCTVRRSYKFLQKITKNKIIPQNIQTKSSLQINHLYNISISNFTNVGNTEEIFEIIKQENISQQDVINQSYDLIQSKTNEQLNSLNIKTNEHTPNQSDDESFSLPIKKLKKKEKITPFKKIILNEEQVAKEMDVIAKSNTYKHALYKCEMCYRNFPSSDDLNDHFEIKHNQNKKLKCDLCKYTFSKEHAFQYHLNAHIVRYECNICQQRFSTECRVLRHRDTEHGQYDVLLSETNTSVKKHLKSNQIVDKTTDEIHPHKCMYCHKTYKWKTSLRKHTETHKIEKGLKRKPYCQICNLTFKQSSNLQRHVKYSSQHEILLKSRNLQNSTKSDPVDEIESIKRTVSDQRGLYVCTICGKKFQLKGNYQRHMQGHEARVNKHLYCAPCNKNFSSKATYKQHITSSKFHASGVDLKYTCNDCGKRFSNKIVLADHINWEHLKVYIHRCDVCQKPFKSHNSLYIHKQVHDKVVNLCDHCGKSFPSKYKLRTHISGTHSVLNTFQCVICKAKFNWQSCLTRHVKKIHKGEECDPT